MWLPDAAGEAGVVAGVVEVSLDMLAAQAVEHAEMQLSLV